MYSKILVFSDIHFGEQLNSPLKLDIAKKNIEFITNIVQEQGIKDIVFCGDWFHSRNSISVNTFFQSYEALKNAGISGAEREEYLSYVQDAKEDYYKSLERRYILEIYKLGIRNPNQFCPIFT